MSRLSQARYDELLRASRDRARQQKAELFRQAGIVGALDIGLKEVRRRLAKRAEKAQHEREELERAYLALVAGDSAWRAEVDARRERALSSATRLELMFDRRTEEGCVAEIKRRLSVWIQLRDLDHHQTIDDLFAEWQPCDFYVLRYHLDREGGYDAYQTSMHWKIVREAQQAIAPACERCGACRPTFSVHTHHLHYETLGAERPGVDLVTLCAPCHLDGEHGDFNVAALNRLPSADGIPS
jgi:hypothetical protein